MSELITSRQHSDFHWQLLTTVSALSLLTASVPQARAEEADRPTVWVQLGGQMESQTGQGDPFIPGFVTDNPTAPGVEGANLFAQKPSALSTGFEGALIFQPSGSDWVFSAAVRYGRSNRSASSSHAVKQELTYRFLSFPDGFYGPPHCCRTGTYTAPGSPYTDLKSKSNQAHTILDFQAGKDVGLGLFGRQGSSVISAGVRFAQFTSKSNVTLHGLPRHDFYRYDIHYAGYTQYFNFASPFHQYAVTLNASRSFHGIGPSISWNASASVLGSPERGEVDLDWGVNAGVLFGKQRVNGSHHTLSIYHPGYVSYTQQRTVPFQRSRSVTVPNVGGFAGLSFRFDNAKVSLGYRGDFFFGAMDTGMDERKTKTVGFYGPFGTVSIGLGG